MDTLCNFQLPHSVLKPPDRKLVGKWNLLGNSGFYIFTKNMFSGEQYVDSLYSDSHVQFGTEELLLPLNTGLQQPAYPTQVYRSTANLNMSQHGFSGMVTHLNTGIEDFNTGVSGINGSSYQKLKGFDPSNYMTSFVNKNAAPVQVTQVRSRPAPSTPKQLSSLSPEGSDIYEATYSGVNVYELIVDVNSIMRRRQDSWVNATHILKVKSAK